MTAEQRLGTLRDSSLSERPVRADQRSLRAPLPADHRQPAVRPVGQDLPRATNASAQRLPRSMPQTRPLPHRPHRYVTVPSDNGVIVSAARHSSRATITAGCKTAARDRSAGRMRYAPCSTFRMSTKRGSTTFPTISRSPRSHTSCRRFAELDSVEPPRGFGHD